MEKIRAVGLTTIYCNNGTVIVVDSKREPFIYVSPANVKCVVIGSDEECV